MHVFYVLDLSRTLIMLETAKGIINPYDEVLAEISHKRFGGIPMTMSMANDGQLFPHHIAEVIQRAHILANRPNCIQSFLGTALQVIEQDMRPMLVEKFSAEKVLAAPGLEKFLFSFPLFPAGGIVTGDLRDVARVLMSSNTCCDLASIFPPEYMTCGDDHGPTSRIDQVALTVEKLNPPFDSLLVFVDDAPNGIQAMAQYVQLSVIRGLVVAVETGSCRDMEVFKEKGANIVVPDIGHVRSAVSPLL